LRVYFREAFSNRFRKPNKYNFVAIFSSTIKLHHDITVWPNKIIRRVMNASFLCLIREALQKRSKNSNLGKLFIQAGEPIHGHKVIMLGYKNMM